MKWLARFFTQRSKALIEVTYTDRSTFPPFEFVLTMNPKTDARRNAIRDTFYDWVIDATPIHEEYDDGSEKEPYETGDDFDGTYDERKGMK